MKKSELFQQYYREFLPKIYRFVFFRVGGKRETAEDLTSEIFIKALDNFDSFDEAKPFSPWIYQIAKNCRTSVEMIEKYYASHIKN
ncbi:MAG: RNA polymerase sigma factor, partial [Patescibacteria group bacterium]